MRTHYRCVQPGGAAGYTDLLHAPIALMVVSVYNPRQVTREKLKEIKNEAEMEQTLEQTIRIVVPTVDGAGGSTGGSLANTGAPLFLIAGLALLLVAIAIALFVFTKRRPAYRHALATHGRRTLMFLLAFGLVAGTGNTSVLAAPALSVGANQTTLQISVPQGGGTATASTKVTVNTANSTGYSLAAELKQTEPGIGISLSGGNVSASTALAVGGAPLSVKQTAAASAGDDTDITLTFTIDGTVTAGTKQLKLAYKATDNDVPVVIDQTTCRSGDPTSGCQVDMDAAMIPIAYTGSVAGAQWSKADTTTPGNWYDYSTKQWANAVTVSSASLASYQAAPAGTVIDEADVLAYYAYIPRYEYQVCRPNASDLVTGISAPGCPSDITTPYDFNIKFQKPAQTTAYNGTTVGGWATHPAFTFGTTDLSGIWVGKYETSSSDTISDETTATAAVTNGTVRIKPNQNGLSYQNVSTQFATAQSFTNPTAPNFQGLNSATTDTRMARDADWGAATYLATSAYGKGAANPVYINNCLDDTSWSNYNKRTGWSGTAADAGSTGDCVPGTNDSGAYYTAIGQQASTTGNPTGLYDMSGGNYEYTMGNFNHQQSSYGDYDGFGSPANFPDVKYLDIYPNPPFTGDYYTNNDLCTWATCGGRALHETKTVQSVTSYDQSWGSDVSGFVSAGSPWFIRGGSSSVGSYAGVFATGSSDGSADYYVGFRAVQSRM